MAKRTYKQIIAIKEYNRRRVKKLVPDMENRSGIYIWHRPCEAFYAGQSIHLIDRSVEHLMQYGDHLANSIRKHDLCSEENPSGWQLEFYYCEPTELDEKEREVIAAWSENNIPYNITCGGQNAGKYDIGTRKAARGYRDGVEQGYKKAMQEVAKLIDGKIKTEIDGKETATKLKALEKLNAIIIDNKKQK